MTVEDLVRAKVAEVPAFGPGAQVGPIVRMASLTNQSFKVAVDGRDYILRIVGHGTEEYIDRGVEEHAAQVTAQPVSVRRSSTTTGSAACRSRSSSRTARRWMRTS